MLNVHFFDISSIGNDRNWPNPEVPYTRIRLRWLSLECPELRPFRTCINR